MSHHHSGPLAELLLTRRGRLYFETPEPEVADTDAETRGVELELAHLGFVAGERLRRRLRRLPLESLAAWRQWAIAVLAADAGADRKHEPLFRKFPGGVPEDTAELWWQKVLVHFLQEPEQPCLFCARTGTTHVLRPCAHVVCEHCFDGANYSACPVCEHRVDRDSPFFLPSPERPLPEERVTFRLLDLGGELDDDTRGLFASLCARTQALSETDRRALTAIVRERPREVLTWLPDEIPVRENVALVFGTLFGELPDGDVLPAARRFMTTATDVLRFIAVLSGTDGSLQAETLVKKVKRPHPDLPFWRKVAATLQGRRVSTRSFQVIYVPTKVHRFKVARMRRSLRRALLAVLDGLHPTSLREDMLRHRSYWVWVGEFLHPHEYAKRFPNAAGAFQLVRKKAPDGTRTPAFRTWNSRVETLLAAGDTAAARQQLRERPGELARRYDHLLRLGGGQDAVQATVQAFVEHLSRFATPVLLTLRHHLPLRTAPIEPRIVWPKGRFALGVSVADARPPLPADAIAASTAAIDRELLRRFEELPVFSTGILDMKLGKVMAPFNERTASVSAIDLPRGSKLAVAASKTARLFLHWCQPDRPKSTTDLDLSVAFYDASWTYAGVCSYYELELDADSGETVARSAGDRRDAPPPDGASEFVDVDLEAARRAGIRYAVMVVNSYAGVPFSRLDRAFAGLMLRDDVEGSHFDPRTVELKFALDGENGVFLPLVFDLEGPVLHWLDVHNQGHFAMNNVETSRGAIAKLCPESIAYFASGARPSIFDLGLLHMAARCRRVIFRDQSVRELTRSSGEDAVSFLRRLRGGEDGFQTSDSDPGREPVLALLHRGDIELPEDSLVYALFRERLSPDLAASDLLV